MGTVYRTAQLEELGIGRRRRQALVTQGQLHRVEHGVYCTAPPEGGLLLRAVAHTRPHLAFSGVTARQIHDGVPTTTPLEAVVQRPHNYRSGPLVTVRQVRTLATRTVNGHRVVPPVGAVGDLLAEDSATARAFLERHYAGREGNATLAADLAAMGPLPPALRTLLASASIASDSKSEQTLARALKARGITLTQNFPLGHYHWDFAIPHAKILIDLDSFRYHAALADGENERTFVIDRWKANDGARRGWLVLHYTGECVYRHLDRVVEQVADTVTWRTGNRRTRSTPPALLPCEVAPPWTWHHTLRAAGHAVTEPPFFSNEELRAMGVEPGSPEDPNLA